MEPEIAEVLATIVLPRYNAEFYLGLFALSCSIALGLYYAVDWMLSHRRREHVTLLWSAGIFFSFWFQIPFLLANAGLEIVVTDFHALFSVMIPVAFLGLLLIYRGIRAFSNPDGAALDMGLTGWFVMCGVYFGLFFYKLDMVTTYAPIIFGAAFFFMTLFCATVLELIRWYRQISARQFPRTAVGIVLLCITAILLLATTVVALLNILNLPPAFWFVAIMSSATPYVLQSVGVLTFAFGVYFIHQEQMAHDLHRAVRRIRLDASIIGDYNNIITRP